ncbi:MAG: PEP-CTERM sorting domain-containing protein [Planctomycetota bacterium]
MPSEIGDLDHLSNLEEHMKTRCLVMGLASASLFAAGANAAFVVGTDVDGVDNGSNTLDPNFSFGGDTTSASDSTPSAAVGASGFASLFGGNGSLSPDTYVFSYTPGTDVDNFSPAAGSLLGSTTGFGTETASGLVGGGSGQYNVYITVPATTNISGGNTTITATSDSADVVSVLDLNNGGTGADLVTGPVDDPLDQIFVGGANDAWFLLGTVDLTAGVTYTVTWEAGTNSFVSMRAAGVLWEAVPEPATASLLGLGALAMLRRRSA